MRISDWSSDVCSSDLSLPPRSRRAGPPCSLRHDRNPWLERSRLLSPARGTATISQMPRAIRSGQGARFRRRLYTCTAQESPERDLGRRFVMTVTVEPITPNIAALIRVSDDNLLADETLDTLRREQALDRKRVG